MIADVALGKAEGALNICSGTPITVADMALSIADEFGRRDLIKLGAKQSHPDDPLCVLESRPCPRGFNFEGLKLMERVLYLQPDLPIFQNKMYGSVESARNCPKGQMRLVENLETGLVNNAAFDSSLMDYDSSYQNEQGNSPEFKQYLQRVANLLETKMGSRSLVEVGYGKGKFLELMLDRDADIVGYDPTYEGDNPKVRREYFSEELGIQGEGLILRHVLEHIENPVDFLFQLAAANNGTGLVYIEVPCFDWICRNRAWFDIFYEHVNYFRLSDFKRIFGNVVYAGKRFWWTVLTGDW